MAFNVPHVVLLHFINNTSSSFWYQENLYLVRTSLFSCLQSARKTDVVYLFVFHFRLKKRLNLALSYPQTTVAYLIKKMWMLLPMVEMHKVMNHQIAVRKQVRHRILLGQWKRRYRDDNPTAVSCPRFKHWLVKYSLEFNSLIENAWNLIIVLILFPIATIIGWNDQRFFISGVEIWVEMKHF